MNKHDRSELGGAVWATVGVLLLCIGGLPVLGYAMSLGFKLEDLAGAGMFMCFLVGGFGALWSIIRGDS